MPSIDLRSDTVTLPTPAMREAMARAEVGDDGFGEDPTINRLQTHAAELMGKEAGLYVPSGTMSNLVAVLTHCSRGQEMIVGSEAHMFHHEVASSAGVAGVQVHVIPNDTHGRISPSDVEAAIRPPRHNFPTTSLLCLENTQNRCGGAVLTPKDMAAMGEIARRHNIPIHLDGARIFNAAVYLGIEAKQLAREATSVTFCLSKGLSAPVGSVLCGPADFIARARKHRQMVGGGMRQAGVIAAAGIVALDTMVDRLAQDHENARLLARGLARIPGLEIDPESVQTNILMAKVTNGLATDWVKRLAARGVKILPFEGNRIRFVTHYGIDASHIEEALSIIGSILST